MKKPLLRIAAAAAAVLTVISCAACTQKKIVPVGLTAVAVEDRHFDDSGVLLMESSLDAAEFTGGGPGASASMTKAYADIFSSRAQAAIEQSVIDSSEYYTVNPDIEEVGSYTMTAGVLRSDENMFVLSVTVDFWQIGAAHGYVSREALCFDPNDGSILTLSDLTADGSDPTARLAALLSEKYMLTEYSQDYEFSPEEAAEAIEAMLSEDIMQWYIDDEFVLISNPYDLAPYFMGGFELTLSADELSGVVDAKWFAEGSSDAVQNNIGDAAQNEAGDAAQDEESGAAKAVPAPQTVMNGADSYSRFGSVHTIDIPSGYVEENLIWWDCDVSDVFVFELVWDENYEQAAIGSAVYTLDSLAAGDALLLSAYVPEVIPSHGISASIDGAQSFWALGYNGRDGGLSFVEITPRSAG